MPKKTKPVAKKNQTAPYKHPEAKSLMRPEVGTQAQFKKKKPPKTYRYDSSLSPTLDWAGKNPAREQGETVSGLSGPSVQSNKQDNPIHFAFRGSSQTVLPCAH